MDDLDPALLALDTLVRVWLPGLFGEAGLHQAVAALRALPAVTAETLPSMVARSDDLADWIDGRLVAAGALAAADRAAEAAWRAAPLSDNVAVSRAWSAIGAASFLVTEAASMTLTAANLHAQADAAIRYREAWLTVETERLTTMFLPAFTAAA